MVSSKTAKLLLIGAFVWGFSEATWFFIIPDVYLTFAVLIDWKKSGWCLLAVLCGTMLGACFLYELHSWDWQSLWSGLPGYRDAMMTTVGNQLNDHGPSAVQLGPASGIPYRYCIWTAANQNMSLSSLLWVTPIARVPRMLAPMLVAGVAARLTRKWIPDEMHKRSWVFVWLIIYVYYWGIFLPQTYP